ncbi:Choline/ethanolamine kinase [Gryllus bimaculatus]|nr:Choline/ethanolamine kinase [Gryllus bimaculatus]
MAGAGAEAPARVLLRLYGQLPPCGAECVRDGIVTEAVVFTLLSESQRGPRLLGVFPGGRLEEYIPARPLLTKELSDSKLSRLIAEKMAQIHLMNVPINKEPHWWMNTINTFMGKDQIPSEFQSMCKKLLFYELKEELSWLKQFLIAVKSPVVFCHNDVQEGNILLRNGDNNDSSEQISQTDDQLAESEHQLVEQFFESYLNTIQQEQQVINDCVANSCDEIEKMMWETKAFTLASHFFWGLWSVVNATVSKITFDYWAYGENRFEAYFKHKSLILPNEDCTDVSSQ